MANDGRDKTRGGSKGFYEIYRPKIKQDLIKNHPVVLPHFKVNAKDREYQFWKRSALSIELKSMEMFKQKLEYIHYNPVVAGLCGLPEEYKFSTARFYETGINHWNFITDYTE